MQIHTCCWKIDEDMGELKTASSDGLVEKKGIKQAKCIAKLTHHHILEMWNKHCMMF